ncbi:MAG: Fic family protein, partial [Turicibacter sp.]
EIQNLKRTIEFAYESLANQQQLSLHFVNNMHKIILDSVRGNEKQKGMIRTTQNFIGPRGAGMESAIFIPPVPEDVIELLTNLYEYMNDAFVDPLLINVAVAHAQFETIHPYKDGNGRLGRALIPIQMAMLDNEKPILYLSEIIELYKPSYQRNLMESRRGNVAGFIKFFLQCVIDQCNVYVNKLNLIKEIYKEDMKKIEAIKGNSVYKIMPIVMRQIVFTKKEIQEESGVSVNATSNIINQLVELNILVKDDSVVKKGYRYQRIYEVFVGKKEFY